MTGPITVKWSKKFFCPHLIHFNSISKFKHFSSDIIQLHGIYHINCTLVSSFPCVASVILPETLLHLHLLSLSYFCTRGLIFPVFCTRGKSTSQSVRKAIQENSKYTNKFLNQYGYPHMWLYSIRYETGLRFVSFTLLP